MADIKKSDPGLPFLTAAMGLFTDFVQDLGGGVYQNGKLTLTQIFELFRASWFFNNEVFIRGRNAANDGYVNMIKTNATDFIEFGANVDLGGFTINGRDIAADGTKLDTIEENAQVNTVNSVNGQTNIVVLDTGHIAENTNLYFTNERVDDRVAALIQNGTGISWAYDDGLGTFTPTVTLAPFDTDVLAEGAVNKYASETNVNSALSAFTQNIDGGGYSINNLGNLNIAYSAIVRSRNQADTGYINLIQLLDGVDHVEVGDPTQRLNLRGQDQSGLREDVSVNGTRGFLIAIGTTLERPSAPLSGTMRYNSTTQRFEGYENGSWEIFNLGIASTDDVNEGATNLYFTNARADARIALQKGAANGIATLGPAGKIPSSQIPAYAISETYVVASEVSQLAAGAEIGDFVVRTDENKTYIHNGGTAGDMTDFTEFLTTSDVLSVNGQTGVVVLNTDDVAEGSTNFYYSETLFDSSFAGKDTDDLTEGSVNFYYTEARFDVSFAAKDTDDLAEGSVNFFYTEGRFDSSFAGKDTDDLTEGSVNFFYTEGRFDTSFAAKDTDDLAEGATNKYATGDEIQGDGSITNVISVTQATYDGLGTPDANTLYVIVG